MTEPNGSDLLLRVEHLAVRYGRGAVGISDVSLGVGHREVVALLGPNGAGKTTTVRAIGGFMRTEPGRIASGDVVLDGRSISGMEPHRIAGLGVAIVPERHKVFPNLTVAENLVALGRVASGERREVMTARIDALFPDLVSRRRQLAGRLSGGQQQMLALARALMAEPRLLIVDEMTLGLSPILKPPLFRALRQIADAGTAVLVVDESTADALDVADTCYILRGGVTVDHGEASRFVGSELLAAGYVGPQ